MKTSIQIWKIIGIPIRLHITFLLILPVFAWIFATNEQQFGGFSDVQPELLRYSLGMAVAGPAVSLIIGTALISIHEILKLQPDSCISHGWRQGAQGMACRQDVLHQSHSDCRRYW